MNPVQLGAMGLISWGIFNVLKKKRSPLSTQATAVTPTPSVQPRPSATVPSDAATAAIQNRLNILGTNPPLVVDGISGPKTPAAIKAFQASRGIDPDGIVGPITLAALGLGPAVTPVPVAPAYVPPVTAAVTQPPSATPGFHQTVETWADEPEQSLVDHF